MLAQQPDKIGEESQEEVCLSGTMVEEPCLQQPQEGLVENFESSVGAVVCDSCHGRVSGINKICIRSSSYCRSQATAA